MPRLPIQIFFNKNDGQATIVYDPLSTSKLLI